MTLVWMKARQRRGAEGARFHTVGGVVTKIHANARVSALTTTVSALLRAIAFRGPASIEQRRIGEKARQTRPTTGAARASLAQVGGRRRASGAARVAKAAAARVAKAAAARVAKAAAARVAKATAARVAKAAAARVAKAAEVTRSGLGPNTRLSPKPRLSAETTTPTTPRTATGGQDRNRQKARQTEHVGHDFLHKESKRRSNSAAGVQNQAQRPNEGISNLRRSLRKLPG